MHKLYIDRTYVSLPKFHFNRYFWKTPKIYSSGLLEKRGKQTVFILRRRHKSLRHIFAFGTRSRLAKLGKLINPCTISRNNSQGKKNKPKANIYFNNKHLLSLNPEATLAGANRSFYTFYAK